MVAVTSPSTHAASDPARSSATAPAAGFRSDVQALRAIAVSLVVLYHAHLPGLTGGFVGVDVFFVISGFLITGLLAREHERTGKISILGFYARRMRRIVPAASLVLVATVVASYAWLGYIRGATIANDAQWAAGFMANFHFASQGADYLGAQMAPSTLQHYWSLAVEEQFYVVWPALFVLLSIVATKLRSRAVTIGSMGALAVASYVYSIVFTGANATGAYFSPLTRACELAAGALVALSLPLLPRMSRRTGTALTVAGLVAIVVVAFTFTDVTAFPGAMVALPVLATCAVLVGGRAADKGAVGRMLAFAPVQWLGLWSFSLYLWHWPMLTIAEQYLGGRPSAAMRAALVVGATVLAALTYRFLENPVRNARVLRTRPALSVVVGLALIGIVIVVCVAELSVHPAVIHHTNMYGY